MIRFSAANDYPLSQDGGVMPNFRNTLLDRPYILDPIVWDHARAMRFVGTVRACILRKADDMASRPVVIERETSTGWEPLKRQKGNVVDVWYGGNPRQTGLEVWRDYHANYTTHGNAYLVAETFGMATPSELWVMPSHLVEVVPGKRRLPEFYVFNRGGPMLGDNGYSTGGVGTGGTRVRIPAENVVPWHGYQPEDEPIGTSPLDAIQLQYETRYDLMRLFQKVVRNGGVTAGYFSVPQPANGVPVIMNENEKKAAAEALRRGRQHPDRPTILDMLKFERMGLTMQQLQFIESLSLTDADICRGCGVPPWMVHVRDSSGSSGRVDALAASEERMYWEVLRTERQLFDALMTEKLGPMFREENIRFRTDFSTVPALNQPLLNSAQQIVALTGRPPFTVNEIRVLSGQPVLDDPSADELMEPAAPRPFGQQDPTGAPGENAPSAKPADTKPAPEPGSKSLRLIDNSDRAQRWRQHDRLMLRFQKKFEVAYVHLIGDRKRAVLAKLEAGALRAFHGKRSLDLEDIFAPDPDEESAIAAIYEQLIAERGKEAAREIALELEVNLQSRTVARFIKARESVGLKGAMDTLMGDVRREIAEGITLGEGLSDLAARVSRYMDEATQGRVLTIARTESVSAYNFAGVEAWRQSGEVEQLEWVTARDSAVREEHAAADGEVVAIDADGFDVGGETLQYPGDPAGSPSNTCNCRCVALPVLNERARRRLAERERVEWQRWFPSKNGHAPASRLAGVL